MRKLVFMLMFILVISTVTASISVVYPHEVDSGEQELIVSVYNRDSTKSNVRAYGYLPYLDIYGRSKSFKFRTENPTRIRFMVDIPDGVTPDYYPMIISLENEDGFKEKKGRWVYIS